MNEDSTPEKENYSGPILLGGGPLGLGDPDDKRLRKVERDIIVHKKLKEEATLKCGKTVRDFLECAKREGFLVTFRCRVEYELQEKCIARWLNNKKFVNEITEKYLEERTYYRKTGKPLHPINKPRTEKKLPPSFDEKLYDEE